MPALISDDKVTYVNSSINIDTKRFASVRFGILIGFPALYLQFLTFFDEMCSSARMTSDFPGIPMIRVAR